MSANKPCHRRSKSDEQLCRRKLISVVFNRSVPSCFEIRKYCKDIAVAGYDKTRSLWIGNLQPWMDANYFINFFNHLNEVVQARVFRDNQAAFFPRDNQTAESYAFIQFASSRIADRLLRRLDCVPMANSQRLFRFKLAEIVCGEEVCPFNRRVPRSGPESIWRIRAGRLLTIHFVRVERISNYPKRPPRLYGTVRIEDISGIKHKLYDRSSEDYEMTGVGRCLTLEGPVVSIAGAGFFLIDLDIKLGDGNGDGDDQVVQGKIEQDSRWIERNSDLLLETEVEGKNGNCVTVGYSIIGLARSATVEVLLIKAEDGSPPTHVYGTIKAVQDIGGSKTSYIMFDKSDKESVRVPSNHPIPLTRPVVAAPLSAGLTIEADLFDCCGGGRIVKLTEHFVTETGSHKRTVCGPYEEVQVSVFFL